MSKTAVFGDAHLMDTSPRCRKDDYFASVLAKIEGILVENDTVICLGDLFHKPTISIFSLHKLVCLLLKYRRQVYYIPGNHDVYNMNVGDDSMHKTVLHLLKSMRLIHEITGPVQIDGVWYEAMPLLHAPSVIPASRPGSILLGHYFFESALDPKFSITREDLAGKGYSMVLLGHDHEPHDPVKIGDTIVFRFGSIGRHTSHKYNLQRTPVYMQIVGDGAKMVSTSLLQTKGLLPEAVFFEESWNKENSGKYAFTQNLTDLLAAFKRTDAVTRKLSMRKVLEGAKAPQTVLNYIESLYFKSGLAF